MRNDVILDAKSTVTLHSIYRREDDRAIHVKKNCTVTRVLAIYVMHIVLSSVVILCTQTL